MTKLRQNKQPVEPDQLTYLIAAIAAGGQSDDPILTDDGRDLAAVLLGRRGGLLGGRARADKLTPAQRTDIAKRAATARWNKAKNSE